MLAQKISKTGGLAGVVLAIAAIVFAFQNPSVESYRVALLGTWLLLAEGLNQLRWSNFGGTLVCRLFNEHNIGSSSGVHQICLRCGKHFPPA